MRRTCNKTTASLFFGLLALLLFCPACYEPSEACLDIYATNFDANADNPCENECCTYPNLKFTIDHLFGEDGLRYDSTFYDIGSGDSVRIVQIIYFLSEVQLNGPDGALVINDEVTIEVADGSSQKFADDFVIVDYNKGREYTLGSFKTAGSYDTLSFRLGLNDQLAGANPISLPDEHVLNIQADTMWQEQQSYALARVRLVTQSNNTDTLSYFVPAAANGLTFGFPLALNIDFGVTTSLGIQVDYQKWLAGIDFVALGNDEAAVVAEIVKNLPNSISLAE